ncbi:MAG: hypothetical protein Q8909_21105, partial [Bacteroidota bacterium]|nr:hypothetical protein [Bacteroidota bacterium]
RTKNEMFESEKNQNGTLINTSNFGILKSPIDNDVDIIWTKAYIFQRADDNFDPKLHVWYHFDQKTEILKGIKYYWGLYNPSLNPSRNRRKIEQLTKQANRFFEKYFLLQSQLEDLYGKPVKVKLLADDEDSFIKSIYWEDNEKIICLSIRFDRKIKEIPLIGILNDPHIEILATFKYN